MIIQKMGLSKFDILTKSSRFFTFLKVYTSSSSCLWFVDVPNAQKIVLSYQLFQFAIGETLRIFSFQSKSDYFQSRTSYVEFAAWSIRSPPILNRNVSFSGSFLAIAFTSNQDTTDPGFSLTYRLYAFFIEFFI